MYKKNPLNMLREKRRHANQKPNRRLDAKSSRGMIYENEELRLRTININAEVERGQSEIKHLKREREILRREIWTLRDEYDKLEKILKMKGIDIDEFLNSNNQSKNEENEENEDDCSSCSCSSEEEDDPEQLIPGIVASSIDSTQALQQNQKNSEELKKSKDRIDKLHVNFDHLSIVSEENSDGNSSNFLTDETVCVNDTVASYLSKVDAVSPLNYYQTMVPSLSHFENLPYEAMGIEECSAETSANFKDLKLTNSTVNKIMPREEYQSTNKQQLKHFFAPIRKGQTPATSANQPDIFFNNVLPNNMFKDPQTNLTVNCSSKTTVVSPNNGSISPTSSFQTGGNLEELLYDIETLSKDILELQTQCQHSPPVKTSDETIKKPFRSELNLFLAYPNDKQHPNCMMDLLPSPFPTNPSSPITPPTNFNSKDPNFFDQSRERRLKNIIFPPLSGISSNNSMFCTVSAPSTPASSRKEIEKFQQSEVGVTPTTEESDSPLQKEDNIDKKKAKRVSYLQNTKEEQSSGPDQSTVEKTDCKEMIKDKKPSVVENNHNHQHSHIHSHPSKLMNNRRMSLDTTLQQTNSNRLRHANHRVAGQEQPASKVVRNNSNRSYTLVKKRSRSDSTFGNDHQTEGGTSMSERNSNSLASSRESSTSLSLKSQSKRRISITSHGTGSKIPWCGCWGNGCI